METFIFHTLTRPQGGYAALRHVFCGVWAYSSYIFLKEHKICNWLIYNTVIFGKPHFSLYGEPQGLFCTKEVFCLFWANGSYIFLKVHKICNWLMCHMTIFGNFDFSSYGEPLRGLFCPLEPMHSCALIVSLTFFDCLGVRNIWAKFQAFITICKILTVSCASGLDYMVNLYSQKSQS